MNSYFPSQEIKVNLELKDGKVFTGRCLMSTINVEQDRVEVTERRDSSRHFIQGSISWDMNLQGIGRPEWRLGSDLAPGIVARFLPEEWECEYCGRANPIKEQQCGSCGWYRGVFVEVANELGVWRVKR